MSELPLEQQAAAVLNEASANDLRQMMPGLDAPSVAQTRPYLTERTVRKMLHAERKGCNRDDVIAALNEVPSEPVEPVLLEVVPEDPSLPPAALEPVVEPKVVAPREPKVSTPREPKVVAPKPTTPLTDEAVQLAVEVARLPGCEFRWKRSQGTVKVWTEGIGEFAEHGVRSDAVQMAVDRGWMKERSSSAQWGAWMVVTDTAPQFPVPQHVEDYRAADAAAGGAYWKAQQEKMKAARDALRAKLAPQKAA